MPGGLIGCREPVALYLGFPHLIPAPAIPRGARPARPSAAWLPAATREISFAHAGDAGEWPA
jgi:hypothetical protein